MEVLSILPYEDNIAGVKNKLRGGWTIQELIQGYLNFKGDGFSDDTHWFPYKKEFEDAQIQKRLNQKKIAKDLRNIENAKKRAEAKAKSHYNFGVFINHPVKGIVGREALRSYRVWDGIIARCYNPKHQSYKNYGGRGCSVNEKWRHYQDFVVWYDAQQIGPICDSWQVDKDILVTGNLEYGPDTCVYVPHDINTFFVSLTDSTKGFVFDRGLYRAGLSIGGVKNQRSFECEEDALDWYRQGKRLAAQLLLWKYSGLLDQRVVTKLSEI